jgi:predicted phosphoribosyltransferase
MDSDMFAYKNREEAGRILAGMLAQYAGEQGVVLAIPRGGVPIGYEIASALGFALDLALTKKIGHPFHKEYAIGAVSLTDRILIPHERVSDLYVESETIRIREQLRELYQSLKGDRPPEKITGKITILADDGIATGHTIESAISVLRKEAPLKLIVAAPVASAQAVQRLTQLADEIVCPLIPAYFSGVGAYYEDFTQTENEVVHWYLNNYWKSE